MRILALFIFGLFGPICLSQVLDNRDVVQVNELAEKAAENGKWKKAQEQFQLLYNHNKSISDWSGLAQSGLALGKAKWNNLKIDQAINQLQESIQLAKPNLPQADTTLFDLYYQLGIIYFYSTGKYDKAKESAEEAYKIGQQFYGKLNVRTIDSYHLLRKINILNNFEINDFSQIDSVLSWYALAYKGQKHVKIAMAYNTLGMNHYRVEAYQKALDYFLKAYDYTKELTQIDSTHLTSICLNIGGAYSALGYYDESQAIIEEAKTWIPTKKSIMDLNFEANLIHNLATVYINKGDAQNALDYYLKAVEIHEKLFTEDNPRLALTYLNIGVTYDKLGAFFQAEKYTEKAIDIIQNALSKEHYYVGFCYNTLGIVFYHQKKYDRAIEAFLKGAKIDLNQNRYLSASAKYDNITSTYIDLASFEKALKYAKQTRSILKKHVNQEETISYLANNFSDFGRIYTELGQFKRAQMCFDSSISLKQTVHGTGYYEIGRVHAEKGKCFEKEKAYEKALEHYDEAIQHATDVRDQSLLLFDQIFYLEVLLEKANIQDKLFTDTQENKWLLKNHQLFQHTDSIVQRVGRSFLSYEDKINFNEITIRIYEGAISNCFLLFNQTKEVQYANQAFTYMEQSKANTLIQQISSNNALQFGNLPDSLIAKEKEWRVNLNFYKSLIAETEFKENSDLLAYYKKRYFEYQSKYARLINHLEHTYPNYHRLKYLPTVPSCERVRKELIQPDNAILSYFVGEKDTYLTCITKNDIFFSQLDHPDRLKTIILEYRNILTKANPNQHEIEHFQGIGHRIYEQIWPTKFLNERPEIQKVIIIPSGIISVIPFEILPTENRIEKLKYSPYLINRYTISYSYASGLYFEQQKGTQANYAKNYGGFAPKYQVSASSDSTNIVLRRAYSMNDLRAAQSTVQTMATVFKGDAYIGAEASESNFKIMAGNYKILHLAMHGWADDKNPLFSKLIFNSSNENNEDDQLTAAELYNLSLNADLTILGACNTGYGEIQNGEGIMSLSRGFAYAGCSSIIASLWNIPDESTASITKSFLTYCKEGLPKDEALRFAKLDYLAQAPDRLSVPFFWAGLILIGENSPISFAPSYSLYSHFGWFLLGASLVFLFWKYRSRLF